MNAAQGPTSAPFPGLRNPPDGGRRHNPPKAIQLLVPVWGITYTSQFLEISLPTLLSPGNLPALAKALPCKVIFLTSSTDAADLKDHAAIHYLRSVCDVELSVIDDLITGDNYSTTITLACQRTAADAGRLQWGRRGQFPGRRREREGDLLQHVRLRQAEHDHSLAPTDAVGTRSPASDDAREHGEFSIVSHDAYQPAVLA